MLVARFYQISVCGDDVDDCGEMRFAFISDLFYTYELLATILYDFFFMLKKKYFSDIPYLTNKKHCSPKTNLEE